MAWMERLAPQTRFGEEVGAPQQEPLTAPVNVMVRPELAPEVQLIGEMPGTGYKDRQWLLQCKGQFIQVTELVYRVAEQIDGKRTLEEIATGVTEATDWIVAAEHVQQLIQSKLRPLGLIATQEETAALGSGAAGKDPLFSSLSVQARVRTLSPRGIDRIARVLQVFFAPPVLVPILLAAAVAHWWLYSVHGIAGSIHDVLFTPGGLLLIMGLVIAAAVFHEFGHASALRYGGGRTRGMGAGLYLMYPVFYTDVTDSYRLGRWARVRTDLGGVYFHLIFALGLITLFAVLKKELLLFAVLMINLEILRQFVPLVRLDGYWMLADLTGVPDFFSLIEPFVSSTLRPTGARGNRLPDLRPWVKAAFAAYIIITVPLLAYLLFVTVRSLPRYLAALQVSFAAQAKALSVALRHTDFLAAALSGASLLLLALSTLGTLYFLYNLTRTPITRAWAWSRPTLGRRAAGALGAAGVTVLVGFMWAPQVRQPVQSRPVATSTRTAIAVLECARRATAELRILRADLEGSLGGERFTGTVVLRRPNQARIDVKGISLNFRVVSDGIKLVSYFPGDDRYVQSVPGPQGRNIHIFVAEQIDSFFRPERIGITPAGSRPIYRGREGGPDVEYDVVEAAAPAVPNRTTRWFISTRDHLVHRVETITNHESGRVVTAWADLKNVRTDVPVDETAFRWKPPTTAGPLQLPSEVALPTSTAASR